MSPEQIAQLSATLDANTKKTVFIAMHYPIHPLKRDARLYPASRTALKSLFAKHPNIAYVFAAHEHLYYYHNPQGQDSAADVPVVPGWKLGEPTRYLVSGGAGAKLDPGGKHHWLIFTMKNGQVTGKYVPVPKPR